VCGTPKSNLSSSYVCPRLLQITKRRLGEGPQCLCLFFVKSGHTPMNSLRCSLWRSGGVLGLVLGSWGLFPSLGKTELRHPRMFNSWQHTKHSTQASRWVHTMVLESLGRCLMTVSMPITWTKHTNALAMVHRLEMHSYEPRSALGLRIFDVGQTSFWTRTASDR